MNALRVKEKRFQNIESNKVPVGNKRNFKNLLFVKDSDALAETKRSFMTGGQKWMPKRLGRKVRHRDLKAKLKKKKKNDQK